MVIHMRVAAIDIGSNSVRLLVADVNVGDESTWPIDPVTRAGAVCRLARGLDQAGIIEAGLAQRAGSLAAEFVRRARSLGARHILIGATAAIRNARNGAEVAEIVGGMAGLPVRVLSGDEEARLVYRSVVLGFGGTAARSACVVFDIGGGSTEVVSGVGVSPGRWVSLPFGAVSLTERFLLTDPPSVDEVEDLRAEVSAAIMQHCAYMPDEAPLLAGVGGAVTILGCLDRGLVSYEPSMLEGWCIQRGRLPGLVARLVQSRHDERRVLPAVGEGRADIAAAGALVVELLVERFPSRGLVCSTRGLRYGLVRMAAEEARGSKLHPESEE
jgi:exopolyphosphatase/guanosine-5'-triphosphate,3'-diphosphate pyrophosphatase